MIIHQLVVEIFLNIPCVSFPRKIQGRFLCFGNEASRDRFIGWLVGWLVGFNTTFKKFKTRLSFEVFSLGKSLD